MADYNNGKIYKLSAGDLIYIGSTIHPLPEWLIRHKKHYKQWVRTGKNYISSFQLFQLGEPTMELIELFPCSSKRELRVRQGFHQQQTNCVNKIVAGRTPKEYYQANRLRILKRQQKRNVKHQGRIRLTKFIDKHIQKIALQKYWNTIVSI